jgi:quercetin dioxygenase-like cupin family protein
MQPTVATAARLALAATFAATFATAPAACTSGADAPRPTPELSPTLERGLVWGPAPAVFPPGAQLAVVRGDPSQSGEQFVVRLRMPDGYRIAPHTHPTDEHVTVLAGEFRVGLGTRFRAEGMQSLPVGASVTAPAGHAHFAAARGTTIVQVQAIGPFALTYVDPNDLPIAARGGGR